MRTAKFNFIPEHQLGEEIKSDGAWRVTLLAKNGKNAAIYFPSEMVRVLELDGKYMKFYADTEKKAIGWTVVTEGLNELNEARLVKPNPKSGAVLFGIGKLLKGLNYALENTINNIRVEHYTHSLIKGEISYVILPPKEYGAKIQGDKGKDVEGVQ